jgi:hypothetical protein
LEADVDDDNVVDAELVGDGDDDDRRRDDIILSPCHHGCTCGLHQQVTYGEKVPPHDRDVLDHGEMGLLIKGVRDTTLMLNSFHELLRKHRAVTVETYSQALRALRNLRTALNGDAMRRASAERDRVEEAYADLTPDERQPAPLWLKAIAVAAFAGMPSMPPSSSRTT